MHCLIKFKYCIDINKTQIVLSLPRTTKFNSTKSLNSITTQTCGCIDNNKTQIVQITIKFNSTNCLN